MGFQISFSSIYVISVVNLDCKQSCPVSNLMGSFLKGLKLGSAGQPFACVASRIVLFTLMTRFHFYYTGHMDLTFYVKATFSAPFGFISYKLTVLKKC